MIRSWILAIALLGVIVNSSEARGRNRSMRSSGQSWTMRSPVRYSNSGSYARTMPPTNVTATPVQNAVAGTSSPIQQISYQSVPATSNVASNPMQAWAEDEARMMAERGTCGHVRGAPMGYFVGVGCGMTCMGSGTLVAEAHYQGKSVRVWRR